MVTEYLNALNSQRNLTLQEISDLSNVPFQTVRNIFSGETTNPGINTLVAIVKAMGGSMDELVGLEHPAMEQHDHTVNSWHEYDLMVEKYEDRIEKTKKSYEQRIIQLNESHDRQVTQLNEGHDRQVEQLETSHNRQIDLLTESNERRIRELNESFERRIKELNDGFERRTTEGNWRFYSVLVLLVVAVVFILYLFLDAMHGNWGIFRYQEIIAAINPSSAANGGAGLMLKL